MKKIFLLITLFAISSFAESNIYIKVGEAQTKKSLLALPVTQLIGSPAGAPNYQSTGAQLFNTIQNDLEMTGYFQFIDRNAFLEDTSKTGLLPSSQTANGFKFDSWKNIGAEFLIKTGFSIAKDEVTLEAYVYHVTKAQLILGKKYKGKTSSLRRVAHTFGNDLIEALTGARGMFLSKIVVASDKAGGSFKEIYIMDWDGENDTKVTNHKTIAVSPAWSADNSKIAYTAYVQRAKTGKRNPDLFIYDINSGNRWLASYQTGLNSGAAFLPDSKSLLLTISKNQNPDIYHIKNDGTMLERLTNGPLGAMNVEPNVSPDGKQVVFSSDRSGSPKIYTMSIDGGTARPLTTVGKYNSSPAWSPDGTKIAFAGYNDDHFDIFIMNADGSNIQKLTSARKPNGKWSDNEDPSFSPNGQHIMFTSDRTGKKQIFIVNTDGSNERYITKDNHNYFKPRWSKNFE